ncbi:MAG: hypothetical protein CFE27_13860 [Alphaproteobacteria bacterium PA1]|nr:MAG: hypothetical protein CFE27_13860 [Alphaproteobacteria bacterium PA1]
MISESTLKLGAGMVADPKVRELVANAIKRMHTDFKGSIATEAALQEYFYNFIAVCHSRCNNVKTFLSEDEHVELKSIYVSPNFRLGRGNISEEDVLTLILQKKRVIIEGTGGIGKTIFMKRFWTRFFEDHSYVIPIFIELRRFNSSSPVDFLNFVRVQISNGKLSEDLFNKFCEQGRFAFFFDGYDEVSSEAKHLVNSGIEKLSESYPSIFVVISTRPERHLASWDTFAVVRPQPFSIDQSCEVVRKITFDQQTKNDFINKIKSSLYNSHSEFLSNPLLINIMLLTFREFAEIPDKITVFYERAFDVLYAKHDAKKGLNRDKRTKLTIDEFKLLFSNFCFASYSKGVVDFKIDSFKHHFGIAAKLSSFTGTYSDFLHDLCNAACMLREEGDSYYFNHRSFQEFFAAYAINKLPANDIYRACLNFINRGSGNVVVLFKSHDRTVFEREFAVKYLEERLVSANHIESLEEAYEQFERFDGALYIQSGGLINESKSVGIVLHLTNNDVYYHILLIIFPEIEKALRAVVTSKANQVAISAYFSNPRRRGTVLCVSPKQKIKVGFFFNGFGGHPVGVRSKLKEVYIKSAGAIQKAANSQLNAIKRRIQERAISTDNLLDILK